MMAKSYHNNKNIDINNAASQTVCFDKPQMLKNNIDNHKISSTPNFIKE